MRNEKLKGVQNQKLLVFLAPHFFFFFLSKLIKLKDYKDITTHRKLLFEFDFFGLQKLLRGLF